MIEIVTVVSMERDSCLERTRVDLREHSLKYSIGLYCLFDSFITVE